MSVRIKIGDIFTSECTTLVNTVNCVGVMGKGIAAEFKKRYPEMFKDYKSRCDNHQVKLGEPYLYTDMFNNSVLMFPTKDHWRAASRLNDIDKGLDYLAEHYHKWGIDSIAVPPLGCGNGGLEWSIVGPLMYEKLSQFNIPVEIYAPFGTSSKQLTREFLLSNRKVDLTIKGVRNRKVTPGLVALFDVVDRLQQQRYANPIGRTIFQEICYVMTEQGIDTGMTFQPGEFGPFSTDVQSVITLFANTNAITESQLGKMTAIRTTDGFAKLKKRFMKELISLEAKIDKTVDLFARIKNTSQAEEVSIVLFAARTLKSKSSNPVSQKQLYDYILEWKENWNNDSKKAAIAEAITSLEMLSWVKLDQSQSFLDKNAIL